MDLDILNRFVLGNRVSDYLTAVVIIFAGLLFVKIVVQVLLSRFKQFAEKTSGTFDDLIARIFESIILPGLYASCFLVSFRWLNLPSSVQAFLSAVQLAVIAFLVARSIIVFLGYVLKEYLARKQDDPALVKSLDGIFNVFKFLVWILAFVVFLDNIGFKVSTMIAGLGIGGIAVAIAAQTLLKDFFSYFSILFDRPFKLGDFIIIGDFMGTVEYIGIKTTRIRSLGGEQLIFSNTDLTDSRVRNYRLMERRRVLFRIGVTYQTPLERLKEIPGILQNIIRKNKGCVFDRAHFSSYGDFSLIFEIVYYVLSPDYNVYMDIQQEINFSIREEFDKRGIEFAYPTQTLFIKQE